ncbi:MAG: hypothetical protein IPM84_21845, partial [Anaerolineae bacterium]|nr:hypothetical protein [Anaerolineae bacterium]
MHVLMYRWQPTLPARWERRRTVLRARSFWESADDGRGDSHLVPHAADRGFIRIWTGDIEIHITADSARESRNTARSATTPSRDYGAEMVLDGGDVLGPARRNSKR